MERYARQEILKEIGVEGQKSLAKSTAVVVGAGATGTIAAELLVRAGVSVRVIDRDFVELSNLQRTFFTEEDLGQAKALAAQRKLRLVNSTVLVEAIADDLSSINIKELVGRPGVVLDCTDNMQTRFLLNDYCLREQIPWIYSGVVGTRGMMMAFSGDRPCLACFMPQDAALETCDTVGVLNAASHVVAALQVKEAIRILLGEKPRNELLDIDVWKNVLNTTKVNVRNECIACVQRNFVHLKDAQRPVALCGRDAYHVRLGRTFDLQEVNTRLSKIAETRLFDGVLHVYSDDKRIVLFANGRAIVEAANEQEARSRIARYIGI